MQESQMLIVESVGKVKADKNKIPYKQLFLATTDRKKVKDVASGVISIVKTKVKRSSIIVFGHSYLDLVDLRKKSGVEIKDFKKDDIADLPAEFGYDAQEGEKLEGAIVTRKVGTYPIVDQETAEERLADYYTTPILGNTEDEGAFDQEIVRVFRRQGHPVEDEKLGMTPISTDEQKEEAKATF